MPASAVEMACQSGNWGVSSIGKVRSNTAKVKVPGGGLGVGIKGLGTSWGQNAERRPARLSIALWEKIVA
jgi:hypothetical protein